MNEIDSKIKEIDKKIDELEKIEKEKVSKMSPLQKEKLKVKDVIDTIKVNVEMINSIDDIKSLKDPKNKEEVRGMLIMISCFMYLKDKHKKDKEYKEACDLILSIGKKHPILNDWCKTLISAK